MKKLLAILLITQTYAFPKKEDLFKLHVVHLNDFHSRFEEVNLKGRKCEKNDTCVGGYSRLYRQIMNLKQEDQNLLLLNAGDNFQGSMWYSVYRWEVIANFMKKFQFDAFTIGNHEFDDKIEGLIPFIKSINSPVVLANIDDSKEPTFQNIYNKSTIVTRDGKKIGIIGALTKEANEICNGGNLVFLDESESINKEAERLVKEEDVFTNIVLSHCGYGVDKEIARKSTGKISLIVGGHSHTYLGDDTTFKAKGPYPTVVQNQNQTNVLIVQASSFSRHLGNITLFYNKQGKVVEWEGASIFLNHDLPQDEEINKEMAVWQERIKQIENEVIGQTLVPLKKASCVYEECLMGNFFTDAMVYYALVQTHQDNWTGASIAFINPKGFRSDIDFGDITYGELTTTQPFANSIDISTIQGKYLIEIFEVVAGRDTQPKDGKVLLNMLQVAGVQAVLNVNNPPGKRVQSLKVRCANCRVPVYEDVKLETFYKIITPSFLSEGGDGFDVIQEKSFDKIVGYALNDIFRAYLRAKSPIFEEIWGRIQVIGEYYKK